MNIEALRARTNKDGRIYNRGDRNQSAFITGPYLQTYQIYPLAEYACGCQQKNLPQQD